MKRYSAMTLCLILILSLMCGCSSKKSQDSLDKILEAKKMIVGVNTDNLPLSYMNGTEFAGFDIDIANEVAKRLDVSVEFKAVTPENAISALEKQEIDCYWCYDAPSRTLMSQALFADSLYKRSQAVLVKNDSDITEIVGLKNKIVGVESNSRAEQALSEATVLSSSFAECKKFESFDALSASLSSGAVNAAVVDSLYAKYAFISKNKGSYRLLETAISTSECRMVFRKKDSVLKNKIYGILDNMIEDSTVVNISQKWFGEDITQGISFNIKIAE